jgi:hypothetical protein
MSYFLRSRFVLSSSNEFYYPKLFKSDEIRTDYPYVLPFI